LARQQQERSYPAPTGVEPQWWLDLADVHTLLESEALGMFKCPLSFGIMHDPWMIVETTSTFEYRAIHEWVVVKGKRGKDPKTQVGDQGCFCVCV
jgi:hypothetical protein